MSLFSSPGQLGANFRFGFEPTAARGVRFGGAAEIVSTQTATSNETAAFLTLGASFGPLSFNRTFGVGYRTLMTPDGLEQGFINDPVAAKKPDRKDTIDLSLPKPKRLP